MERVSCKVKPYIFKIETPSGSGTGFLCLYNEDKTLCGISTAYHVVDDADEWQQPIRLTHHESDETLFLKETDRFIFTDRRTDSAVILFSKPTFKIPEEVISLLPRSKPLDIGNEVGWLGFPRIEPYTLCFFSGNISAIQSKRYLIDGVAIHGVSGGPVIFVNPADGVQIVGIVSAYMANRMQGDTLPGLLYAQDVSSFHDTIEKIKTMDDARKKKEEEAKSEKEKPSEILPPIEDSKTRG